MKRTQNEKILQIQNFTLVVGIDIGKEVHYARAIDYRGIELAKVFRFHNTAQGYGSLDRWIREIMEQNGKTEAIVGFEPTGHYWFTLGDHLERQGHRLAIVNPFHVHRSREFDDNSPTKNDRKDPKTIAMLVKDGRYRDVYIPADLYSELREAVSERERLQEQLVARSNRIQRWLDIRFPEFGTVFKDWSGKTALCTLEHLPTPARIVAAGPQGVLQVWKPSIKKSSLKTAERLVRAASGSIGRTAGHEAAEASLANLLREYALIAEQQQAIEQLLQELLLRVPHAAKLTEIKGVGMVTAAVLVSEIGDIRRFQDPRQILKMAGLNLKENSSGKHQGKTTISRRGRKRLREGLFRVMIAMLATNGEFRSLHQRNLTREKNPLNKMQSVVALCGKLVRVLYALLTKGAVYDAEKMMNDIHRSMKAA
jgi:transposase